MARGVFSWFGGHKEVHAVTKQPRRQPSPHDISEEMTCNSDLTKGLYHNTYAGLKLAGALAYAPIAHPVMFMGLPTPKADNKKTQETLDAIVKSMARRMTALHIMVPRDGTAWIWPKYDRKGGRLIWEFIPDDTITAIVKSPDTQEVVAIYTDEEFKVATSDTQTTFARRKRKFTAQQIEIKWESAGELAASLMDKTVRNVLGILPIAFANMAEPDNQRGISDYERMLPDLKNYHDIDLARSEILTKFKPKMIQEVNDLGKWLDNNGYNDIGEIDPWSIDFVVNIKDLENTKFETAKNATDAYEVAMKTTYWKIVECGTVPEIFWGLQASGNEASVDDQRQSMIRFVEMKRTQITPSYERLFRASLELLGISGTGTRGSFEMGWNRLDGISEKVKSEIFKNFASGLAVVAGKELMTKKQIWNLWKTNYPEATEATFEEFMTDMQPATKEETLPDGSAADDVNGKTST